MTYYNVHECNSIIGHRALQHEGQNTVVHKLILHIKKPPNFTHTVFIIPWTLTR